MSLLLESDQNLETAQYSRVVTLSPENNRRLQELCGHCDEHLQLIEKRLSVRIRHRGYTFSVSGESQAVEQACRALEDLYRESFSRKMLPSSEVHLYLQTSMRSSLPEEKTMAVVSRRMEVRTKCALVTARGENQVLYLNNIQQHDINFGIGPAGTGKTWLAVASAVQALESGRVSRIILVRPIVEAGERLGFLPGDLAQKVHPYLRPLYDGLYEMLGFESVNQMIERDVIEIVPLAYMRGRSLNDSFIILDEGQNTTAEQMKMFLTRIGFNSKAVITGDATQIDLLDRTQSGLMHALNVLKNISGISVTRFEAGDVVRHPLVQRIVEAYENYGNRTAG